MSYFDGKRYQIVHKISTSEGLTGLLQISSCFGVPVDEQLCSWMTTHCTGLDAETAAMYTEALKEKGVNQLCDLGDLEDDDWPSSIKKLHLNKIKPAAHKGNFILSAYKNLPQMLLWVELKDPSLVAQLQELLCDGMLKQADVLLTCDDKAAGAALLKHLDCHPITLPGVGDMAATASKLHLDFKLVASLGPVDPCCLLDKFKVEDILEAVLRILRRGLQMQIQPDVVTGIFAEPAGCVLRLWVSNVAMLHGLREIFLRGDFERDLTTALTRLPVPEPSDCSSVGSSGGDATPTIRGVATSLPEQDASDTNEATRELTIKADRTQFAEQYDETLLALEELTPSQRQKLKECGDGNAHIKAAAGAGKTFVALHLTLEVLRERADRTVLFVAKSMALASFFASWLSRRAAKGERDAMLGRLHMLAPPKGDGPRLVAHACTTEYGAIKLSPLKAPSDPYTLVVVDEAHFLYSQLELQRLIEPYASTAVRLFLLSDASQSIGAHITYPADLRSVELTEVVRSSQRIVFAANAFRCDSQDAEPPGSHHSVPGPPLKPILFDAPPDSNKQTAMYAAHTLAALRVVCNDFPGLRLHNRIAIIVPDAGWREQFESILEKQLSKEFEDRCFQLVDAQKANSCGTTSAAQQARKEWLVLDTVEQFDGLERLFVIAVGLDSPIEYNDAALETRSRLYRALTRAQMMVIVVNEKLRGGWLEFLGHVRFNSEFDARAEEKRRTNAAAQITARSLALRDAVKEAAVQRSLSLTPELQKQIVRKAEAAMDDETATVKIKESLDCYKTQQTAVEEQLQEAMAAHWNLSSSERPQLHPKVMMAVLDGMTVEAAVQKVMLHWSDEVARGENDAKKAAAREALKAQARSKAIELKPRVESALLSKVEGADALEKAVSAALAAYQELMADVHRLLQAESTLQDVDQENIVLAILGGADRNSAVRKAVEAAVHREQEQEAAAVERVRMERISKLVRAAESGLSGPEEAALCTTVSTAWDGGADLESSVEQVLADWSELRDCLHGRMETRELTLAAEQQSKLLLQVWAKRAPGWDLTSLVDKALPRLQDEQGVWDTRETWEMTDGVELKHSPYAVKAQPTRAKPFSRQPSSAKAVLASAAAESGDGFLTLVAALREHKPDAEVLPLISEAAAKQKDQVMALHVYIHSIL